MDTTRTAFDGSDASAEGRLEQELERLKARAYGMKPSSRRPSRKFPIALLVIAAAAGAGAAALWLFMPESSAAGSALRMTVAQAREGITQTVNEGVDRLFGGAPAKQQASAVSDDASSTKPDARPRARKKSARGDASPQPVATGRTQQPPELPLLTLASAVMLPEPIILKAPPELPVAEPDPNAGRVYGPLDTGVTPPIPLQPALGRTTATDQAAAPGDMDVVIDRTGAVERVVLLTPNRYQDRMLIYAVKNRQFRPATANGRPVSYRLRIRTGS